jgi:protein-S-isoprenylcysteine O-methyltransferase Ste14
VIGELFFRFVFAALWFIFFANLVWVTRSAGFSVGNRTTRRVGLIRIVALAFAAVYFVAALLYATLPSSVMFSSILLPDWFRLTMVVVASIGVSLVSWSLLTLGRNWAPSLSGVKKDATLVTTGPYCIVRHPIYFGAFIFLIALAFVSANLLILLPTLALLMLLYTQIGNEEATLISSVRNIVGI